MREREPKGSLTLPPFHVMLLVRGVPERARIQGGRLSLLILTKMVKISYFREKLS